MASKRTPPSRPERPRHTAQEKLHDIEAIERRIRELDDFNPATVTRRFDDPNVQALQTAIDETLSDVFGHGTEDYQRYVSAARLDNGGISMIVDGFSHHNETAEAQQYVAEGKVRAVALLKQAIRRLGEEIDREQRTSAPVTSSAERTTPAVARELSRRIFIVHGHDQAMREAVARLLAQLDFEPVILHEQANQGRTLIEKFEDHGETAQFAIVLLSGDDEGRALRDSAAALKPRARQNVILELGYFAGRLGRTRVCALMHGEVELPSDVVGVVYEPFDERGAWRYKLASELRAAGYAVDLNRL